MTLADTAPDIDESIHYEHLLLELDGRDPIGPAGRRSPVAGTKAEPLDRLEAAVDKMIDRGCDGLSLELLLADAFEPF